jgi:hypothetical protein
MALPATIFRQDLGFRKTEKFHCLPGGVLHVFEGFVEVRFQIRGLCCSAAPAPVGADQPSRKPLAERATGLTFGRNIGASLKARGQWRATRASTISISECANYIKELGLLARCVMVIDGQGTIKYVDLVQEVTDEPDYDASLKAARAAV